MALAVKLYLHRLAGLRPVVHRLKIAEPYTYRDLRDKVEKLAGGSVSSLRWRDAEKDLVSLSDDEDLKLAGDYIKEQGQDVLRVHAEANFPTLSRQDLKYDGEEAAEGCEAGPENGSTSEGAVVDGEATKASTSGERPFRKLPGGGRYTGFIRTTDADGKTVERELTLEEAEELLRDTRGFSHHPFFSHDPFFHRRFFRRRPFFHPFGGWRF